MTDPYRQEREAKWRTALVNHASVLELCAEQLRAAAEEVDCNRARHMADEAVRLAKEAVKLIKEQSVDNPPRRADA